MIAMERDCRYSTRYHKTFLCVDTTLQAAQECVDVLIFLCIQNTQCERTPKIG